MAFNIKSILPEVKAISGLGKLDSLYQNKYDISSVRYPLEVGTNEVPHYVTFNINLPENSKYISKENTKVGNTKAQDNYDILNKIGGKTNITAGSAAKAGLFGGLLATVQTAFGSSPTGGIIGQAAGGALSNELGNVVTVKPKFNRIKKSISIYMPDTVISSQRHSYNSVSLTEALGKGGQYAALGEGAIKLASDLAGSAASGVTGQGFKPVTFNKNPQGAELAGIVGETTGATGAGFTELALKAQNVAINPQAELIFKGTPQREYNFQFDFQPRSQKEAMAIQDIIKSFKMYAAPEISNESNGRYFIPPAQFDISFFFQNTENNTIAKISSCVLVNIVVNYSQQGSFSSFDDGHPVHISMMLDFMEVDIITRELIEAHGF
jgi:hypothetical protein